ncbi:hypothetical protein EI613_26990 [Azospirillum sp. 412522]|nr:hypothetical protein [Azospirillum sp. 412522]MBY6265538.1 hypothetical protein [Azospirillum sp. 412522]
MTIKTERFEMRTSVEFARVIDQWRRRQDSIPSRSDAVRSLVAQGLMYETLDKAIVNILSIVGSAVERGDIPDHIGASIVEAAEPYLNDLKEYTEARKKEVEDMRKAIAALLKFKEERPEEFEKSPFAAKKPRKD